MPSNRRLKAFSLVILIVILLTLYISASARQTRASQFYTKTQDALEAARNAKEAKLRDAEVATGEDESVARRLQAAAEAAKHNADVKAEAFHGEEGKQKAIKAKESMEKEASDKSSSDSSKSSHSGEGTGRKAPKAGEKGVAGRTYMKDNKETVLKGKHPADDEDDEDPSDVREETEDERKAHAELNDILKKSPIIIFSKSYCPYSKRAKQILLEKYTITPPPYVVELDLHPLGGAIQAYLGGITGRKTVPNVLIQAKSIGGGDDVQELDDKGTLMDTILRMGGKRMQVSLTSAKEEAKTDENQKKGKRHFWS